MEDTTNLSCVEDEALKATIRQVLERLPAHAVDDLKATIIIANSYRDSILRAGKAAGQTFAEGDDPNVRYTIYLSQEIQTEKARLCVVAHKFAHAYLRHPTLIVRMNSLESYPIPREHFFRMIEDQTDLQICLWGFKEELLALSQEFPEARRPTFIDALPGWNF